MLPVFIHHGILAFDELRWGPIRIQQFPGIPDALSDAGYTPLLTRVHPTASIPRRAEQLKVSILHQLAPHSPRAVLIAHSLGGLDARYMLSHLGMSEHIAALLTVTTPHRGASLADLCFEHLGQRLQLYRFLELAGLDLGAAHDLTRPGMRRFNDHTPDHPDVTYFSITCSAEPAELRPKLRLPHRLIARDEGPNDGVVSVVSAR